MENLSKLLERFSRSLNKDTLTKGFVLEIIKETTKVDLDGDSINLKDGVLTVQCNPVLKNELKLKEERILTELKEKHSLHISRVLYK